MSLQYDPTKTGQEGLVVGGVHTSAKLPTFHPPASVPAGAVAYTSDLGPVFNSGTAWLPINTAGGLAGLSVVNNALLLNGVSITSPYLRTLRQSGAILDGVTDDYTAFSTAVTAAALVSGSILIDGPMLLGTSITVPSNVTLFFASGGLIKPAANKTVTINSSVVAGAWNIFNISNSGAVVTGAIKNAFCYAEWFGAVADGVTDSTAALQAIAKLSQASGCIPIYLSAGTYIVTGTVLANGSASQTFQAPTWIGCETRLTVIDGSALGAGVPIFKFRGSSGRITSGHMDNVTLRGNSGTVGVMIQGLNGYEIRRIFFDNHAEALTLHNEDAGSFTEYVVARGCNFRSNCATALRYRVTAGNNSFHGAGLADNCIGANSGAAPFIQVDDGCRPYEAPLSLQLFVTSSSTVTVTFTGSLAIGATSGTLTSNWTLPTGIYPVVTSSGETSLMTLTNGATTATFAALVFPATASGATVPNVLVNNANIVNTPHAVNFFGNINIEPGSTQTMVLGITKLTFFVGGIGNSAATPATGANITSGNLLRVTSVSDATDGSTSFVGGEQGYLLKPLSYPFKLAASNMLNAARSVSVLIYAPNYERRYQAIMDVSALSTISPVPMNSGTSYFQSADSNAFNTQGTGGAGLSFTGSSDGTMNLVPATCPLTLTGAPSGGATTATLTGTNSPWAKPTNTYTLVFSNGDIRNAVMTNAGTAVDWSADTRGGLSGSATTAVTAYQLPIGATSIYVYERQLSAGANGGGHIQF